MNQNNKKILAEKLKQKLNSPKYVAMSDLITHDDRFGDMWTWIWGKKDWKENWISGTNINPGKGNKHKSEHIVCGNELEKEDWEEIINLIEKQNKEKEQVCDQKRNQIKERLNNTPNLYYRFANNKRISTSYFVYPDKHGEYFHIWGMENGREYYLNINANHPVLNNFPWEKNGFYLIETDKKIERNDKFGRPWSDHGEDNPSNFHKWVEIGDQITITPYEVKDNPVKKSDQNDKSNENKQFGGNENNHSQPNENQITNWLTKYFQENSIKEISLENGELVISYNNNETKTSGQIVNDPQLRNIKNYLEKNNKQHLNRQDLNITNSPQNSPFQNDKNNYTPYLIGGAIGIGLVSIIAISFYLGKKRGKKNIE